MAGAANRTRRPLLEKPRQVTRLAVQKRPLHLAVRQPKMLGLLHRLPIVLLRRCHAVLQRSTVVPLGFPLVQGSFLAGQLPGLPIQKLALLLQTL